MFMKVIPLRILCPLSFNQFEIWTLSIYFFLKSFMFHMKNNTKYLISMKSSKLFSIISSILLMN